LRELDEDAQYIGCAPEVLVAGKNVLKGIDKIVNGNKAIDKIGKGKPTGSRSSSSCGRPEIKDFLLNGVQAMCKQAKTVQCRASITSFMCALCFSIMKGEKADHVDAWNLSNSKSVAKRVRQAGREGEEIEAGDVGDTKKQEWEKCGSRRFLKGFSVESQKQMLHESLLAVRDGGFWLMPHWNQFADGESFTALGDAFLPEQVFDYVRLQDEAAATSGNVYKNRFTNLECKKTIAEVQGKKTIAEVQGKMTIAEVQGMFQAPDRHGLKWIPIDVAGTTKALGLAFQNTADAHMKTSSARSDDEASSTDEHLAGAAKTKSKKALTFNELLEEVLAFLLAMSVRQQCTGGAKDKGSSLTHITNSCVKVSIPTPSPPHAHVSPGGASGGEDSRYVDGGGEGDYEGYGQDDTAATAATTGATGATATPAAAATGFTLAGSSQGSSLAPAASGTQFTYLLYCYKSTITDAASSAATSLFSFGAAGYSSSSSAKSLADEHVLSPPPLPPPRPPSPGSSDKEQMLLRSGNSEPSFGAVSTGMRP
jgi:hypothetical protein